MKLETAYRKLSPHRARWTIKIELLWPSDVRVTYEPRTDVGMHPAFAGRLVGDVTDTGLAATMSRAADKLAYLEKQIAAYKAFCDAVPLAEYSLNRWAKDVSNA